MYCFSMGYVRFWAADKKAVLRVMKMVLKKNPTGCPLPLLEVLYSARSRARSILTTSHTKAMCSVQNLEINRFPPSDKYTIFNVYFVQ